jgi:hypothetical protein
MTDKTFREQQDNAASSLSYIVGMYKGTLTQLIDTIRDEDFNDEQKIRALTSLAVRVERYLQIGEAMWNARYTRPYSEIIEDFANENIKLAKK